MSDTLARPTAPAPRSSGPRGAAIAIAIVGGVVGAVALVQGVAAAWPSSPLERVVLELDAGELDAATALDVDMGGADVDVSFADVDVATLEVDAPDADRWRLEVRGTTIHAHDGRGWGLLGWGGGFGFDDDQQVATLVLPDTLEGALDGDVEIGSGSIAVSGDWLRLDVDLASGRADVDATATQASIDVASGSASLDLVVEGDVRVDLASGDVVMTLEHAGDLEIGVASGTVDARLGSGPYDVTSEAAIGEAIVDVPQRPGAAQAIALEIASGSVRLSER
ncbi:MULTISPECIES: hypothetical protein [unclassified Agrococcus]|uniref:hypothetical protein n=1 Tax=unclassified Agrococcus TaxID=2615065 RepID=UPI003609E70F